MSAPLLELRNISVTFRRARHELRAVRNVSMNVMAGQIVALVGESGSGKSTLGRVALRLQDVDAGTVLVDGRDYTKHSRRSIALLRRTVQTITQDPGSSFDPLRPIGWSIDASLRVHTSQDAAQRADSASELMLSVGLSPSALGLRPHQFSGGQRQRLAIARALAANPKLIVCDEPTSALDVSTQATVLNLLQQLQRERGLALLLITHDLAVVRQMADGVAVMCGGELVESGPVESVLDDPQHAYTQQLLASVPVLNSFRRSATRLSS